MQSTPHPAPDHGALPGTRLFAGLGVAFFALLGVQLLTVPTVLFILVGFTVAFTLPVLGPLVVLRTVRWGFTIGDRVRGTADREIRPVSERPSVETAD